MPHTAGSSMSQEMQQCIRDCEECHRVCIETINYCLQQGGQHVEARHMRSLLDCADFCAVTAHFLARGSEIHGRICGVCAEADDRCAQSCDQFGGDAQMQACAQACRRCAESCRAMAA